MNEKSEGCPIRAGQPRTPVIAILLAVALVQCGAGEPSQASPPAKKSPVQRLYVNAFQGKNGSAHLRDRVLDRLREDRRWELVDEASKADAVVDGTGEFWVKGYVLSSPKSGLRSPVYGGYLSLELKNKRGETLWSYLVTPGKMHWQGVDRDMADHIVRLMDAALVEDKVSNSQAQNAAAPEISIVGAGSTFAGPVYQKWIQSFEEVRSEVHASYRAVGSENGIQELKHSRVDFAASDVPLSDENMASMPSKVRQYATVLGGVVPAYNLAGIKRDLRFTPEIMAEIYLGQIARWNDRRLRLANPGARLPDEPIVVIHRLDGSGTTFAWTDFLSRTSPEWKSSVGTGMRVTWPTGEGAEGNEGVAVKVAETPNAIGYVELTYALRHHLNFASIRNAAGTFVEANLTTLGDAAKGIAKISELRTSIVNAPGKDAYPIATFTWVLVPESSENDRKTSALRDLVRWMLTSGQKECAGLGYFPIPKEVAEAELREIGR